jgi:predicted CxxxxCH...CXXCH cytochrome family protein
MSSKTRSFRDPRNPIGVLILLAAFAVAAGCSTANTPGGGVVVNHVDASGNSIPGWFTPTGGLHTKSATLDYIANGGSSSCTECHGSDLAGGISRVSCFNTDCHHRPAGWVATPPAVQNHGVSAKKAPGSSGFASCQICHGNNFSGGGAKVSCTNNPDAACHGPAVASPHPPDWLAGDTYVHSSTDPANAPVCYQCHSFTGTANPNNPHVPQTPAPPGTAPGCFNGTMCHNQPGAPHPVGSAWVTTPPAAQPHGDAAKKDGTVAAQGFAYCQVCHGTGTDFAGGSSGVSCYTCHGVSAPHAPKPWRASAGSTYTHTTTVETGNAPVCYLCHAYTGTANPNNPHVPQTPAPPGTAPGCFNGTMCHNEVGHPVPFNSPAHYSVTSATFPASCSSCHDISAPSTQVGPVCQTCHIAGSPLTALNCTSCHANPPNGATTAYPNVAGTHATHIALSSAGTPITCDTCHNGLGTTTLNHYNRANARPGENALRVPPGDVAFLATYSAKTGASSFDNSASLNCSNVSCHGGQATPNWQTGTIDVNIQCENCHVLGTTQYNSYNSGQHSFHISEFGATASTCALCHNTTALALNHFTTLADNTISPAIASSTVGGTGTLITTWTPGTGTSGTCNAICHPGDRTW